MSDVEGGQIVRRVAVAMAAVLVLAGCSDGGDSGSAQPRAAVDDLRAALITVAEAGAGFVDSEPQVASDADLRSRPPRVCGAADTTTDADLSQARVSVNYRHSTARGPVYGSDARPGGLRFETALGEQIAAEPTEEVAKRRYEAFRIAAVAGCKYSRPNDGATASAITVVSVREVTVAGGSGIELVGRISGPTKAEGETNWFAMPDGSVVITEWTIRQVIFRVGRFYASVYTQYATESFDEAGFDAAVVAARVKLEKLVGGSLTGASPTTAPIVASTPSASLSVTAAPTSSSPSTTRPAGATTTAAGSFVGSGATELVAPVASPSGLNVIKLLASPMAPNQYTLRPVQVPAPVDKVVPAACGSQTVPVDRWIAAVQLNAASGARRGEVLVYRFATEQVAKAYVASFAAAKGCDSVRVLTGGNRFFDDSTKYDLLSATAVQERSGYSMTEVSMQLRRTPPVPTNRRVIQRGNEVADVWYDIGAEAFDAMFEITSRLTSAS